MKTLLTVLSLFVTFSLCAQSGDSLPDSLEAKRARQIDTINHSTFMQLGNNDLMYYECSNSCKDVKIVLTEKYFQKYGIKTGAVRSSTAKTLLEQYTYYFYEKGFERLTIECAGLEPLSKELKLNR